MKPPKPFPNDRPSQISSSHPSERKWKEYFFSKLMESRKKPQSSNSLFWDWSHDVKDSTHPHGKNK